MDVSQINSMNLISHTNSDTSEQVLYAYSYQGDDNKFVITKVEDTT